MAPNKQPSKTAPSAVASGNALLTDYFKRNRRGRPKLSWNLASDSIVMSKTKRRGPVPGSNKRKPFPPHRKESREGLNSFLLKPPGMKGEELFAHIINKHQINPTKPKTMSPSHYLGVGTLDSNRAVLTVDDKTILTKREIMRDAVGRGATMKLAARKLNILGRIKAHSSMTNDESNLAKLKSQCMLAQSIAEIKVVDKAATKEKKSKELHDLVMFGRACKL